MDRTPPGSSVHGTSPARMLEWGGIPSSRGSSYPGVEPRSLALQADSLPSEPQGKSGCQLNTESLDFKLLGKMLGQQTRIRLPLRPPATP